MDKKEREGFAFGWETYYTIQSMEGYGMQIWDEQLAPFLAQISPPSQQAMDQAQQQWDSVAKPLGSLGLLEQAVIAYRWMLRQGGPTGAAPGRSGILCR